MTDSRSFRGEGSLFQLCIEAMLSAGCCCLIRHAVYALQQKLCKMRVLVLSQLISSMEVGHRASTLSMLESSQALPRQNWMLAPAMRTGLSLVRSDPRLMGTKCTVPRS